MAYEPIAVTPGLMTKDRHAYDVLMQAEYCWDNLDKFRRERRRAMSYTYGDQWSDKVRDERGRMVSESTMIRRQGGIPMKNNMIRKLVNTVKGLYINQNTEPICVARDRDEQVMSDCLTELLKYVDDINDGRTLHQRRADAVRRPVRGLRDWRLRRREKVVRLHGRPVGLLDYDGAGGQLLR